MIKEAKRISDVTHIMSSSNKSRALWIMVNKHIGRNKNNDQSILTNIDNENKGNHYLLNKANNYFINQCPQLNANFENTNITRIEKNIFLKPSNRNEVYNTIMELKNLNSVGEDEIPIKLLKHTANELSEPLTKIINLMLTTGIFPDKLKIAQVKAIYKKGEKTSATIDQ